MPFKNKLIHTLLVNILLMLLSINLFFSFTELKDFDYLGFRLGQTPDEVTNVMSANTNIEIDETRFLGEMNDPFPYTVKMYYFPFILGIYSQFFMGYTYQLIIQFNPNYFDFLSITTKLEDKYGEPKQKTSKIVLWEKDYENEKIFPYDETNENNLNQIRLQLEYPSTVKIYDYRIIREINEMLEKEAVKFTNESVIQSNKRFLIDEL